MYNYPAVKENYFFEFNDLIINMHIPLMKLPSNNPN